MLKYWAWILAALYLAGVAVYVFVHPDTLQWDYQTYYYAGLAFTHGHDPYYLQSQSTMAGQEIGFLFVNPPLTLPVFRLLSIWLGYMAAYCFYLGLKLVALVALIRYWVSYFLPGPINDLFPLVLVFGFSGAIYLDLVSGNISIFEQLGIWVAFLALRRKKFAIFNWLVALVGCFKITPIVFLLLPVLMDERRRWKERLAAVAAWGALQLGTFAFQPQLYANFLILVSKLDERMPHNPSILALLRDAFHWLAKKQSRYQMGFYGCNS